jgi:hypothetical protein
MVATVVLASRLRMVKGVCSEKFSEESSDGTVTKTVINSAPITRRMQDVH